MQLQDWTDASAYASLAGYTGAQWAWEFLRRNPDYQVQWRIFDQTWQALEAAYGRPPDRDFCAWKNDPRAWIPARDCADGECRVDQDKVLIECALGARWGFYKFPPDPRDATAAIEGRITWRAREHASLLLPVGAGFEPATQAALLFDLDLPLKDQLEHARRELVVLQRTRRKQGMPMRGIAGMAEELARELRLLDAQAAAAGDAAIARLGGAPALARARARRDRGYLELPGLPG